MTLLSFFKDYTMYIKITNDIIIICDSESGYFLFLFQDFVDKAYQHFNQVLRRDPDHKKARIALKVQNSFVI